MDFSRVERMIERNRKLTSMSSYPFLIEDGGKNVVVWFYYDARQVEDKAEVEIDKICTLKSDETLEFSDVNIIVNDVFTDFEEPAIDEDEYMAQLENIYRQNNNDNRFALISKSVVAPIFKAYETVGDFVKAKN
jgi:hypothetical protein